MNETTLATFGWSEGIALAVAGLSLVISGIALWFARRADRRDEERLKRDREQTEAARKARLVLTPYGARSDGEGRTWHSFAVTNQGPASAFDVRAWLIDEKWTMVSLIAPVPGVTIRKDSASATYEVPTGMHDARSLMFVLAWTDDDGPHERATGVRPI